MICRLLAIFLLLPLAATAQEAKLNLKPALPLHSGWVAQIILAGSASPVAMR